MNDDAQTHDSKKANRSAATIVTRKEIRLLFKSKRRVMLLIALPIIILASGIVISIFIASVEQDREQGVRLWIVDQNPTEETQSIIGFIAQANLSIEIETPPEIPINELLDHDNFELLMEIPANSTQLILEKRTAEFRIWYSDEEQRFEQIALDIATLLEIYDFALIVDDNPDINFNRVQPVLDEVDVLEGLSPEIAALVALVPLYALFAIIIAPMNLSLISVTIEREQNTLEALLLQPVTRKSLMFGKLLYGSMLVIVTIVLDILAVLVSFILVAIPLPGESMEMARDLLEQGVGTVNVGHILILTFGLVLVAITMVSFSVLFSLLAKDEREANMISGILMIFPVVPMFLLMFLPVQNTPEPIRYAIVLMPMVGYLFAVYFATLAGGLQPLTWFAIVAQVFWVYVGVWMAARISEAEGILDFTLAKIFRAVFSRKRRPKQ